MQKKQTTDTAPVVITKKVLGENRQEPVTVDPAVAANRGERLLRHPDLFKLTEITEWE